MRMFWRGNCPCVAFNGESEEVSGLKEETPAYLTEDKVQNAVSTNGADWDAQRNLKQRKARNPPPNKVKFSHLMNNLSWLDL